MANQRLLKVNNLLQQEIALILQREIEDPLIGFVSVTGVKVSADLRHASVYISVLGDEEAKTDSMRGVIRARKHIRALLRDRITLKNIPDLHFHLDETAERAQRIETLLRQTASEEPAEDDPQPEPE